MTGEKREEGVKPCVLSEGVMYASGGIADLLQITDSLQILHGGLRHRDLLGGKQSDNSLWHWRLIHFLYCVFFIGRGGS